MITIVCLHLIRVVGVEGQGMRIVANWLVRRGDSNKGYFETREDSAEKISESNLPKKAKYEWVAADVRTKYSLFRWSRILNGWLNCVPVLERGTRRSIVSFDEI